jgi:hypothetical protein
MLTKTKRATTNQSQKAAQMNAKQGVKRQRRKGKTNPSAHENPDKRGSSEKDGMKRWWEKYALRNTPRSNH